MSSKRSLTTTNDPVQQNTNKKIKSSTSTESTTATALFGSLSIVTYNVAMAQPSKQAPSDWSMHETSQALRREILQHQPDILALQECPSPEWPTNTFGHDDNDEDAYQCVGTPQLSHCGYVALLVHKKKVFEKYECSAIPLIPPSLPMVLMRLEPKESQAKGDRRRSSVFIASCHLAPFKEGAPVRFAQLQALCRQTTTETPQSLLIVAGDMNMRAPEEKAVEQRLQLADAWKEQQPKEANKTKASASSAGKMMKSKSKTKSTHHPPIANKFTWNSFVNKYHGSDAFSFKARFDRIYFHRNATHGDGSPKPCLQVPSFQLVGNEAIVQGSHKFYLSDHFGIAATIQATNWK